MGWILWIFPKRALSPVSEHLSLSDASRWRQGKAEFQRRGRSASGLLSSVLRCWIRFQQRQEIDVEEMARIRWMKVGKMLVWDVQRIGGHVSILSARNKVFAVMFNHDMQERKTGQVVVEDIEPKIFSQLLHFHLLGHPRTEKRSAFSFWWRMWDWVMPFVWWLGLTFIQLTTLKKLLLTLWFMISNTFARRKSGSILPKHCPYLSVQATRRAFQ